jgi:lactonase
VTVKPDGTGMQTIVPVTAGYMPNDLVFDARGGFYFSDFRGISTEPKGGAYYVSPDFKTITPVLSRLAMANGIALSPDGKDLWITEFSRNLLHRVQLNDPTSIAPIGTAIPYHFIGPAPDSMRADSDGNLYVAIYGQGRVMVFNKIGIPIGQVLLPGRDDGHNLQSTSMAIAPGTNDLYIVTSDGNGGLGATIFHAKVLAQALSLYPHRRKNG